MHRAEFDSKLQRLLKSGTLVNAAEQALNTAGAPALLPIDKLAFDVFNMDFPSCPGANTTVSCAFQTLASVLYNTRALDQAYLSAELPLAAYGANATQLKEYMQMLPEYTAMRQRVWESSIPMNSKLRWPPGNGAKSGKLKPQWVIDLQSKTKR